MQFDLDPNQKELSEILITLYLKKNLFLKCIFQILRIYLQLSKIKSLKI
jgi:hypothetical protein